MATATARNAVPDTEGLTQTPSRDFAATAHTVLAVPGCISRTGQTYPVYQIEPVVAETFAIDCHLVRTTGDSSLSHCSGDAFETVEGSPRGALLANTVDEVVCGQTFASGAIEESVVSAGRS